MSSNARSPASRREIFLFLILTGLLSSGFYAYLVLANDPTWSSLKAAAFMWCPGVAAILTRRILGKDLRGLGLSWGRSWRYLPGVVLVPYGLCGAVYGLVWVAGLGQFDSARLSALALRLGLPGQLSGFSLGLLAAMLILPGVALACISTLGEELGWRGLLAPRLAESSGPTGASILTGLVWSVWHYPLIVVLLPRYRPGLPVWYAILCFTFTVTGVSFFYTWLRLRSGSLWPAVILHAASATAQEFFEALTRNTGPTLYLTFEYGAGFVIALAILLAVHLSRPPRYTRSG